LKVLVSMLSILMLLLGLLISSLVYVLTKDDAIPVEVRYVETIKQVPTVVTKEIEVPIYISETETVTEYQTLSDWESLDELTAFAQSVSPVLYFTTDANGRVDLDFTGRCGYIAYQMRDQAAKIGKYLAVQAMTPQELTLRFPSVDNPENSYHALCMAKIGNELYCIEPSTDEITLCYTIK
jgi:hypothetical protein